MDTKSLLKYRSVTACIKASYEMMSGNAKPIMKKTWWAILLNAVCMAVLIYVRMPNKALHDWGVAQPVASFLVQTVIYAVAFGACMVAGGAFWTWINNKPLTGNIGRYALLMIVMGIVAVIPILVVPFGHIVPAVMLREDKLQLGRALKKGFVHYGSLLLMGILVYLILMVAACIIIAPLLVLAIVQLQSQLGALDGDPSGLPAYFVPLFMLVATVCLFVLTYAMMWTGLSFVYLYGAHEALDKQKSLIESQQQQIDYEKD